jgi:ribose 1,5-bisphosphokinase PhnN
LESILEALYKYIIQSNVRITPDEKLMQKIIKRGRENLNEFFKRVVKYYIEYQEAEDTKSVQTIKNEFYNEFHDDFLCTIPSLLHKFLLEKGVDDIVEYRPPLKDPPLKSHW